MAAQTLLDDQLVQLKRVIDVFADETSSFPNASSPTVATIPSRIRHSQPDQWLEMAHRFGQLEQVALLMPTPQHANAVSVYA